MTTTITQAEPKLYDWRCWPQSEALLLDWIDSILAGAPMIRDFVERLERSTSTRLLDWLDHIAVDGADAVGELTSAGFAVEDAACPQDTAAYHHGGAQLPRVLIHLDGQAPTRPTALALKCDSAADVLLANGLHRPIHGEPLSPFRQATLFAENGRELRVVEQCGCHGHVPVPFGDEQAQAIVRSRELWATRQRRFDDDTIGMQQTLSTARAMADLVGRDAAAWLAFAVERDYWQRRNRAAQVQKARQDRMGFGWANHDHHTFRSSRAQFTLLIAALESFGFTCRERFYAGREAGWGAQILEQPVCGLVVFADVDLSPEEVAIDFAHQPLASLGTRGLNTVGLWCGLHGESLLQAGMHHLEAQFRFDALRDDLAAAGVNLMKPFSDFDHLRQAFTAGEPWAVDPLRVQRLLAAGLIQPDQAERFIRDGAVGSHLEDLQRRYGFKGFNQKGVSEILKATDPRVVRQPSP